MITLSMKNDLRPQKHSIFMPTIVFDTNAYRNLAVLLAKHTEDDRDKIISTLKNKEVAAGFSKELNFWVVCELLSHLADLADTEYADCAEALRIAFYHCSHKGMIKYSPAIEGEIAEFYESAEISGKYKHLFGVVIELAKEFLENGRSGHFEKLIPEIPIMVSTFKKQIESGYEAGKETLIVDRELKVLAKKDFKDEQAYKSILISILYNTMEKMPTKVMTEEQLDVFMDKYYYGLALASFVTGKTPGSSKFQNNMIDIAICLRIGKSDDRLLITDDTGMLKPFKDHNAVPEKAMPLGQYFDTLAFDPS